MPLADFPGFAMHYVIKLFPEITIKSRPVRQRMTGILRENLLRLLRPVDANIEIIREWDRLQIKSTLDDGQQSRIVDVLQRTPGISNFLQIVDYAWVSMDDAFEKTRAVFGEQLRGKIFAVRCKRSGQHDFTSTEVEHRVGGLLHEHCETAGVNLHYPEVMVRLEVRDDRFAIVLRRYEGLGGFPLGTQDAVLSLISGGFDSSVASYLTMKRGLLTHYCFFNLGGRAHELGVKEVAVYLWLKYGASHRVKFVSVPFEDVVKEILERVHNSQMGVILKRMMLRAASQVACEWEIPALVTGESVAQVSSQTLQNLSVINEVTDMLVLRPLITMDKTDIIHLARKIGTEKFSIGMPEYCGVISVKPTTRAKLDKILGEEEKFDFSMLESALANARVVNIDEIVNGITHGQPVEIVSELGNSDVVIDIRHPDEQDQHPLLLASHPVIAMPFYLLREQFAQLDVCKKYALYCDKGVMSQLHAQHLRDDGCTHVKVYRPVKPSPAPHQKTA
jgi:thiamine biosynthesis protein ThiI